MDKTLYADLVCLIEEEKRRQRLREMQVVRDEINIDAEPRSGFREKEMGDYPHERRKNG